VNYKPIPIDTSSVILPAEIVDLTERLARNTHETWAAQRLEAGWTYGPRRDDATKQHPCLIPYEELPDTEREYDRQTVLSTLKAVVALGFQMERTR